MSSLNKKRASNPRLGTVGGQAVMEGVMMKSKSEVAIAVRRMDDKKSWSEQKIQGA